MQSAVSLTLSSEALLRESALRPLTIGLLAPLSGLMGIAGPSIINCAILAAEEACLAAEQGMELILVDAGGSPADVASEVDLLVSAGLVDGLVGTHTSSVRVTVEARLADRVPYIFTPPHEFSPSVPGSVFLGSDPDEQLRGPIGWLVRHRQVARWALIGNDYVWPRQVHSSARRVLGKLAQRVVLDRLVPVGRVDAAELVSAARAARADAILVSLVGRDGIEFHRGVTALDAGQAFVRLCTALDENCLVAAGGDGSGELFSAMPSFILQDDERHQRLLELYAARFGTTAPLPGSYAEGCYDGVHLLAAICGSESHRGSARAGLPPVPARLTGSTNALLRRGTHGFGVSRKPMRLARAVGTDFDVLRSFQSDVI